MNRSAIMAGVGGLLLGLGLAAGWPLVAQPATEPPAGIHAPPALKHEVPVLRGLDSNLYMQTSAEHRACCLQAYAWALARLKEKLPSATDASKPPAVILDLDETVFDNGGFQAMMLRSGLAYDQRLWDLWEERWAGQVGLIPGAKEFLLEADRLGVTPVYISNRNANFVAAGKSAIQRLGLPLKDDEKQLLFATTTSDKTDRRKRTRERFTVLLLVGDNLRDFDERFRSKVDTAKTGPGVSDSELASAIQERKAEVDQARGQFGAEWIILPNPAYGEWMKPLNLGQRDLDRLCPQLPPKP